MAQLCRRVMTDRREEPARIWIACVGPRDPYRSGGPGSIGGRERENTAVDRRRSAKHPAKVLTLIMDTGTGPARHGPQRSAPGRLQSSVAWFPEDSALRHSQFSIRNSAFSIPNDPPLRSSGREAELRRVDR